MRAEIHAPSHDIRRVVEKELCSVTNSGEAKVDLNVLHAHWCDLLGGFGHKSEVYLFFEHVLGCVYGYLKSRLEKGRLLVERIKSGHGSALKFIDVSFNRQPACRNCHQSRNGGLNSHSDDPEYTVHQPSSLNKAPVSKQERKVSAPLECDRQWTRVRLIHRSQQRSETWISRNSWVHHEIHLHRQTCPNLPTD